MTGHSRHELPAEATAENGEPVSTADTPQNRLAAAVRRIADLSVGRPLGEEARSSAAEALERVADELEAAAGPGKAPRGQPDQTGHPQDFFRTSPVIGYGNPVSPPVDVWAVQGDGDLLELRGRAFYGYAYEGPPTCVHGGVIAELFDELLGAVNILTRTAGMTGTLTVRYRKPTPLLSALDLVARRTRVEGRKIFAWGGIYHEGELTAEAEGIFIAVDPAQMLRIVTSNAREASGAVMDPVLRQFVESGGAVFVTEDTPPP